jgi:hypothetical protein
MARALTGPADNKPPDIRRPRLNVQSVDAVVADQRVGHGHYLPIIGRIGQHFLIAGHTGIEHDLSERRRGSPESDAVEDPTVRENQVTVHTVAPPDPGVAAPG